MHKRYKVLKETVSNREYKISLWETISQQKGLCFYCPPKRGCNIWRIKARHKSRSWKSYRKTQYKT